MKYKLSPSQILLTLLAAGQGASLVYASVALDGRTEGPLFWFALVRGLLVGIGASFSSAYAGYQLPRLRHKLASRIGWTALGALVVCSAVVVGVCTVETPQNGLRWLVGGAYAVMVDAAVIATSMASGKVFAEAAATAQSEGDKPAATSRKPKSKLRKPVTDLALIAELRKTPGATDEQLAQVFGVTRQAIQQRRKKLTPEELGLANNAAR